MDQRAKRDAAMRELMQPDWPAVEAEAGQAVPPTLHALYADAPLVTRLDFLVQNPALLPPAGEWSIDCFQAARPDALIPHGPDDDLGVSFCFAISYRGDPYGVLLTPAADGAVFRYGFDGSHRQVAESLAEFLSWPRRQRPIGYEPPAG